MALRRVSLGLAQDEAAAQVGISQSIWSEIETGKYALEERPYREVVEIARALHWSIEEMQAETGQRIPTLPSNLQALYTPETRPSMPKSLKLAAEKLGDVYPELRDPKWQARLSGLMPQHLESNNPQAWVETLGYLKRMDAIAEQSN